VYGHISANQHLNLSIDFENRYLTMNLL